LASLAFQPAGGQLVGVHPFAEWRGFDWVGRVADNEFLNWM
jgi:hypothetical protein